MLYNVPSYAGGVTVSAHVITVLSQHPNIVGMKDTSKEDIGIYTGAVPEGQEFTYWRAQSANSMMVSPRSRRRCPFNSRLFT